MRANLEQKNKEKRKSESLTAEEWMTFFFLPFFTPKPKHRDNHFSESEIERFRKYGFDNKLKQAQKVKSYGYLFWIVIIFLLAVIVNRWF